MKILILEDDDNRIAKFRQNFIGCELAITKNPQEANKWLEEKEFDYIFLDVDLQNFHYNNEKWLSDDRVMLEETSGVATGKFLNSNPHLNSKAEIIIHSLNSIGAEKIFQYCKGRKITKLPYSILWERLRISRP